MFTASFYNQASIKFCSFLWYYYYQTGQKIVNDQAELQQKKTYRSLPAVRSSSEKLKQLSGTSTINTHEVRCFNSYNLQTKNEIVQHVAQLQLIMKNGKQFHHFKPIRNHSKPVSRNARLNYFPVLLKQKRPFVETADYLKFRFSTSDYWVAFSFWPTGF